MLAPPCRSICAWYNKRRQPPFCGQNIPEWRRILKHLCHQPFISQTIYVTNHLCHQPLMSPTIYVTNHLCHQPLCHQPLSHRPFLCHQPLCHQPFVPWTIVSSTIESSTICTISHCINRTSCHQPLYINHCINLSTNCFHHQGACRQFGRVRFLVVRSLYKTNPNPRNTTCCGKKWPKYHF